MFWATVISIALVFFVLVLMVFVMQLFGVVFTHTHEHKLPKTAEKPVSAGQLHEEEIAAITTALKL